MQIRTKRGALPSNHHRNQERAAELTSILIYCQSPILCQAEYKQALLLFESTLRKYLAVKNFDGLRGFH